MIDRITVDKILDAANIVDVVSDFVTLKRAGSNLKGLCPFHDDRTPSFMVSPARNYCKCFACGEGGSPVGFIMKHEQLSYPDALRYLAKKYGIKIEEKELTQEEIQSRPREHVHPQRMGARLVQEAALGDSGRQSYRSGLLPQSRLQGRHLGEVPGGLLPEQQEGFPLWGRLEGRLSGALSREQPERYGAATECGNRPQLEARRWKSA